MKTQESDLVITDCACNELNEHEGRLREEFGVGRTQITYKKLREVPH